MAKFFTSDLHLFHKNIMKYCNRSFSSVEKMNETIISNWNNVVSEKDEVYILGDVTFGNIDETINILKKLKGKKHLIIGNHDRNALRYTRFREQFIWIKDYAIIKENNLDFVLFHFPILQWDKQHYGSIHLYGHIHNTPLTGLENTYSYNVGVDTNNFTPISVNEILEKINYNKN